MDSLNFQGNNVYAVNMQVILRILAIQELNLEIYCREKTSNEDEAKKLNDIYQIEISERINSIALNLYADYGSIPDCFKDNSK